MTLAEIAANIQRGLTSSTFSDSWKFDCGTDGVIVLADKQASLKDAETDCTIKISTDNLAKLIADKLNPMTGVMMGKLKVSGDATIALRLGQLLKA
jgi:putative sterol carrier protein